MNVVTRTPPSLSSHVTPLRPPSLRNMFFFVLAITTVAAVAKDPCSLTVASPRLVDAAAVAAAATAAVRPVGDQPPVLGAGGRRGSRAKRGRGVRARSFCVEPGVCGQLIDAAVLARI